MPTLLDFSEALAWFAAACHVSIKFRSSKARSMACLCSLPAWVEGSICAFPMRNPNFMVRYICTEELWTISTGEISINASLHPRRVSPYCCALPLGALEKALSMALSISSPFCPRVMSGPASFNRP